MKISPGARRGRAPIASLLGRATLLAAALLLPASGAPAQPPPASYVFQAADTSKAPRIDRLVVEIGEAERVDGRDDPWIRVDARSDAGGRLFGYEILVEDAAFLQDASVDPRIHRYVLYPSAGPPLEYVRAGSGAPLLPQVAPRDWLPRPRGAHLESVSFLGRTFTRTSAAPVPASWPRAHASRIVLDPDVLIATSRDFRDDGTGLHGRDYRWVPFTATDYRAMADAGFNLLPDPRNHSVATTLPVFLIAPGVWKDTPDLLLRGSYLGAVQFSDEPAVHVVGSCRSRSPRSPDDVAKAIADSTRVTHEGDSPYGRGFLAKQLDHANLRYGDVRPIPYPAWDAVASSAWYELEGGAGGWCFESRLNPKEFAANVKRALGVSFPADAEACIRLHVAVARGAARRFHRPWGFAVYGQMDSTAADAVFPITYDAGATYFWFWTSDDGHHVPWTRQLQLARALRAWASAHPRGDPADVTARQATAAIVLPWGYALDDWTLTSRGQLWDVPALSLRAKNSAGKPYRAVLAAAMREAVDLLHRGTAFDVLFLRDDEKADGYAEVRRVGADAKVHVERP